MSYAIEIPFSHRNETDEQLAGIEALDTRESSRNLRADIATEAEWLRSLGSGQLSARPRARGERAQPLRLSRAPGAPRRV
jgi:hypothetical protein